MKLYVELFALQAARALTFSGFLARIGQGITVFVWLVLFEATLGNYTQAAGIGMCLTLGTAVSAPLWGRLSDQWGSHIIIPATAASYVVAQFGLLAAAVTQQPIGVLIGLAAASGLATPPFSAAIRTAWTHLTAPARYRALRHPAFSAESAVFELIFVLGPLIFSGAAVWVAHTNTAWFGTQEKTAAVLALAAATTLTGVGALWLTLARVFAPAVASQHQHSSWLGPLRNRNLLVVIAAMAGVAYTFGATPVALKAHADTDAGMLGGSAVGVWIAVWSLGSAIAGFGYGAVQLNSSLRKQLVVLLVLMAGGYLAWLMVSGWAFLVVLALSGFVLAPTLAVISQLVAGYSAEANRTEAYTWLSTATMVFAAIGSGVSGRLVDVSGSFDYAMWGCVAATIAAGVAGCLLPRTTATAHEDATAAADAH